MNITENLQRIKQGKDDIITALQNKGSDIKNDTLINEISNYVDKLEIGGGGDTPSVPTELIQKYEGATVFRINVPTDNYEFAINLCNSTTTTYDVDWGDGVLESGLTTDEQHHTYSKSGIYDVNVYNISKDITLGGTFSIGNEYKDSYNSLITVTAYPYLFNNSNNDIYTSFFQIINDFIVINILIGDKISKINSNAFQNCSSLQSIVIPEGVTSIGGSAFQNCSSLQSVVIPEGVTKIDSYAFYNCSSLQSVELPSSVTTINGSAFYGCSSLKSIVIPEGVKSINTNAFYGCSSLQSIELPSTLTTINDYVFQNCSSLQSIVIPEGVTSIGGSAFYDCSSLQSVELPSSVTTISSNTFSGCSSLQNIVIPEGVTTINSNTFSSCYSLTSVTIPNSVTSIGSNAFEKCYSLQSINCLNPTGLSIQSSTFPTTNFYYPQRILYVPKNNVGYNEEGSLWKTYLIDKGWELRFIEDKDNTTKESILKFKTKNNIKIQIPYICEGKLIREEFIDDEYIYTYDKEITQLSGLLYCQERLIDITIPNTVKNLGRATFCSSPYFSKATEIIVPEGIEYIGELCYYSKGISNFNKVVLPSTIKEIKTDNFNFINGGTLICKAMTAPIIVTSSFGINSTIGGKKIKLRVPEGSSGYEEGSWVRDYVTLEYVPLSEL